VGEMSGPGRAPKQLSVTGKGLEDVVYDASLGVERRDVPWKSEGNISSMLTILGVSQR